MWQRAGGGQGATFGSISVTNSNIKPLLHSASIDKEFKVCAKLCLSVYAMCHGMIT